MNIQKLWPFSKNVLIQLFYSHSARTETLTNCCLFQQDNTEGTVANVGK